MGENKEGFTRELGELLSKYEHFDVQSLSYEIDGAYDEVVIITYKNGYAKQVNVNGDSLSALARDVLKNID